MGLFDSIRRLLYGPSDPARAENWTIGNPEARHPYEVKPDHPAARYLAGMRFCATFQVRTPLRILKRHGQMLPLGVELPYDFERWMGIWVPESNFWADLGIEADEIPESEVASQVGPVKPSEYLPFLIAVREAVEDSTGGIGRRLARLEAVSSRLEFSRFVHAEGGATAMADRLFPSFLSSIPGLPSTSRATLNYLGLSTAATLRAAPDCELLEVTGIGHAKLKTIREFCSDYCGDPEAERLMNLAT